MTTKLISILFCVALLGGCQYAPYANEYLTSDDDVTEQDVVGVYELKSAYMSSCQPELGKALAELKEPPQIEIKEDGHYSLRSFPWINEARKFRYVFGELRQLEGEWNLQYSGSLSDGSGRTKSVRGVNLKGLPYYSSIPTLLGDESVTGLIFVFGDPDSGEGFVFRRL